MKPELEFWSRQNKWAYVLKFDFSAAKIMIHPQTSGKSGVC